MFKKEYIAPALVGMVLGYMLQNYIAKVPVVNKIPVLGSK